METFHTNLPSLATKCVRNHVQYLLHPIACQLMIVEHNRNMFTVKVTSIVITLFFHNLTMENICESPAVASLKWGIIKSIKWFLVWCRLPAERERERDKQEASMFTALRKYKQRGCWSRRTSQVTACGRIFLALRADKHVQLRGCICKKVDFFNLLPTHGWNCRSSQSDTQKSTFLQIGPLMHYFCRIYKRAQMKRQI